MPGPAGRPSPSLPSNFNASQHVRPTTVEKKNPVFPSLLRGRDCGRNDRRLVHPLPPRVRTTAAIVISVDNSRSSFSLPSFFSPLINGDLMREREERGLEKEKGREGWLSCRVYLSLSDLTRLHLYRVYTSCCISSLFVKIEATRGHATMPRRCVRSGGDLFAACAFPAGGRSFLSRLPVPSLS